jgi:catechol 2,3-dioxygenase-like lactoylglutathione lyase family enzyme
MSATWSLTFDAADPPVLAAFWRLALGYVEASPPRGFGSWDEWYARFEIPPEERGAIAAIEDPDGRRPQISFLKVPESKTAKNRVHLDIQAGGGRAVPHEVRWPRVLAVVERLAAGGATVLHEDLWDGVGDHVVMADPEGNEFCVV